MHLKRVKPEAHKAVQMAQLAKVKLEAIPQSILTSFQGHAPDRALIQEKIED